MSALLGKSDAEILDLGRKLREGYKMKRVLRYKTTRDHTTHSESNAEHVFALIYLAHYFLRVEPTIDGLNPEKLFSILLFHDFAEIKHGDINTYEKTTADELREKEAAHEVFASLPEPLNAVGRAHWLEYEEQASPEARFAYVLDKSEPVFELFDPVNERSMKRLMITYDMHVSKKFPILTDYPVLRRFVEVLSADMRARGIFADA